MERTLRGTGNPFRPWHRRAVVALGTGLGSLLLCSALAGAPTVSNVVLSASEVGRYEILEVTADITTQATNLFWPYDPAPPPSIPPGAGVSVDGLFSDDEWRTTITAPGFLYQDYDRRIVSGTGLAYDDEAFTPVGTPHWRVRFGPTRLGDWRVKLRVTDASGSVTYPDSAGLTFRCVQSQSHGFVKVSSRDSRYFELSDGTALLGPGINAGFRSTFEAASLLKTYGSNGVRIVRWWMDYRGWQNPFAGGDVATNGGPQWNFSLIMSRSGGSKSGDRYSAVLTAGRSTSQTVYVAKNTLYRFCGYVKTEGVIGSGSNGLIAYAGSIEKPALTGTHDWAPFTVQFMPSSSTAWKVGVKNTGTSGDGYFDDVSLKSSTDGGQTWSSEMLSKPDFDFQNYVDLKEAWKVDRVFEEARANRVYLKTVVSEKQDTSLGCINADGTTGSRSDDNFYASQTHPSRWLQKAWWRYLVARWGAYTSVHSWELCNEGDPFNGNHWNAAVGFGDYIHSVDPNRGLCCTSCWHSLPMDLWKRPECDYIDLHEYFGPVVSGTQSHGPRFYAWYDPVQCVNNASSLIPIDDTCQTIDFDSTVRHSGARSIRITTKPGTGNVGRTGGYPEYHVGVDPSRTYTVRFWVKADAVGNPGGGLWWVMPGVEVHWSNKFHENDWLGATNAGTELGTYDWRLIQKTGIRPVQYTNIANIMVNCTMKPDGVGVLWADDLEFIDETTGRNLYVDGGFEGDRIDYDTALAVQKYGVFLDSCGRRTGKPAVWAETAIREQVPSGQTPRVKADAQGVHIKKMIWAHAGPANPNMLYWDPSDIAAKGLWYHFGSFQAFMDGIPVSNGSYKDVDASVTGDGLRVFGQKDLVANRAHLWIDNRRHTWRNVVDGVTIEPAGGQVAIDGFTDGTYRVEWWDTITGRITRTENAQCSQGRITLSVSGLATDIACKIAPPPPSISLRITVIDGKIVSGNELTIAVEYTNTGRSEAHDATVTARIPAEMDYIAGSAEATGGTYDPVAKALTWVLESVAPGGAGTRTYRAKVR